LNWTAAGSSAVSGNLTLFLLPSGNEEIMRLNYPFPQKEEQLINPVALHWQYNREMVMSEQLCWFSLPEWSKLHWCGVCTCMCVCIHIYGPRCEI